MAKTKGVFDLDCPCCHATLKIDPEMGIVISHKEADKPRTLENIEAGLDRLKGESDRREDAFRKSFEQHKSQKDVLARKFDELLKQAKADPNPPRKRDIDFD